MFRRSLITITVSLLGAASLHADFTYEQSSKMTGGMMAGMMKFAGAFSKQAREPMLTTVSVKGDKMSMTGGNRISIIDLGAETMTEVDLEKKTYAVMTFADFGRAMQKITEKASGNNDASVNFKANVKQTGKTQVIDGFPTKESVLTLEMEGQDQKSGSKGSMTMVTAMWLAPSIPGYDEVKDFYAKMAQKLAFSPTTGSMGAMMRSQSGMLKGMSELTKEASKLEGVPVLQVVRMGGAADGADNASGSEAKQPPQSASGAAMEKLGLGGFGGFGRKKKTEAAAEPAKPAAEAAPSSIGPTPPGTLMELTTRLSSFSTAAVDPGKFAVPAGFKQIDHDLQKALK